MSERVVVVGADAAGMSAASQAKRLRGDDLEVVALERGRHTSYSACGIPYWVGGDVDSVDDLVAPLFVREGIDEPQPIASLPGVVQHTRDSLRKAAAEAAGAGVGGLIVFGVPAVKDGRGSAADDPAGISQLALADLRAEVGDDCVVLADLCMCEYTDHGHCGLLTEDGDVSNDATLERYAAIAVAQAEAGAHLVAPSGMMDGQVGAIRAALDAAGHGDVGICAYSAKYASGFYGPFREAAEGAPAFGDRASHHFRRLNELGRQQIDQVLRKSPDGRRMAEQLVRIEVDTAVIAVAVIEVPIQHQDA